jgi:hypothetical protein
MAHDYRASNQSPCLLENNLNTMRFVDSLHQLQILYKRCCAKNLDLPELDKPLILRTWQTPHFEVSSDLSTCRGVVESGLASRGGSAYYPAESYIQVVLVMP